MDPSHSKREMILPGFRVKVSVKATTLLIVMSLVQDIIMAWPLPLWFPLGVICLHAISVQNKPNTNQAGVKKVKMLFRRTPLFFFFLFKTEAQYCFKPNVRFQVGGGSSPIPVDYNNNDDASIGNSEYEQTGFKQSDQ